MTDTRAKATDAQKVLRCSRETPPTQKSGLEPRHTPSVRTDVAVAGGGRRPGAGYNRGTAQTAIELHDRRLLSNVYGWHDMHGEWPTVRKLAAAMEWHDKALEARLVSLSEHGLVIEQNGRWRPGAL